MIDPELVAKLDEIGAKADRAYEAAEKIRKYLFWRGALTAALVILPIIGLAFALPQFINTYASTLSQFGL
ncbi:MAG: hypothetical protein WAV50_03705 [Minisyncoccia bacterium]